MSALIRKSLLFIPICILFIACNGGKKEIITTYENGKPKLVYYIKTINNSKQKVAEQMYYENGKLKYEGGFSNNNKIGKWSFFFENGDKFAQCDFTNSPNGEKWNVFLSDRTKIVDDKDNVQEVGFYEDGTLALIKIKKEKIEKEYRFYNSFKLLEDRTYIGNVLNGQSISFFENGIINSSHFYVDGIQDSSYVVYRQNGTKLLSGSYNKGVKSGKWEYFKEDGSSDGEEVYDNKGNIIKHRNSGIRYFDKDGNEVIM